MKPFKVFFILFLLVALTYAGNTGKIVGVVVDSQTGEALLGANIIIEGTTMGAATDIDGYFIILNVPPGKYTVECIMLGYATQRIENVTVQSDQTTQLQIQLSEETLELGEKITAVADRPLIQKDLTASKTITTAEEIEALPVETFTQVMLTQAGITQGADGAIHIKGGRSDEVSYLVDGISVANPYNTNGLAISVANNAIQEMSVVSGAFNAEYGNAMSGIVNLTTKDGSPEYQTFLSVYSGDYISSNDDLFMNIDDLNVFANSNIEGTFSGPLPFGSNNTFFISSRYTESDGYLYGIREHLPGDSANFNPRTEFIEYKEDDGNIVQIPVVNDEWYIEQGGDGKIVPMNPSLGLNLLGKFKFVLMPELVLRVQGLFERSRYRTYSHAYRFNPDGRPTIRDHNYSFSGQLTHTLSPNTYYEMRGAINYQNTRNYLYPLKNSSGDIYGGPDAGDDINKFSPDSRYVPTDKIQGGIPGDVGFLFGGTAMSHAYDVAYTFLGKFDLTSQLSRRHLIKTGVEVRQYNMISESFTILYDRDIYKTPTVPGTNTFFHDTYDVWPRQVSAYLQDKIEYDDMIINAGLRYDYFFSDFKYAVDPQQPDGEKKNADAKHMIAPRLGVSFPVSSTGIIHFSYGHFFQMPPLRRLYTNPDFEIPASVSTSFSLGNANLNPQKTVIYEMGLQQQFGDRFALDATIFYKDIRDLLTPQQILFQELNGGPTRPYNLYRNLDYANVKGITMTFTKRMAPGDPIAASIDYTYQIAEGNDNNAAAFFYNTKSGQITPKEIVPLDWDQTHTLNATVTVQLLEGLVASAIGKLSSGYPYTPNIPLSTYDALANSQRKPSRRGVDLRVSYDFDFSGIGYQVFIKVYNLFDNKNERFVFNDTGTAEYTYANKNQREPQELTSRYGLPGVKTFDQWVTRPDYYFAPREIRLGISVEF